MIQQISHLRNFFGSYERPFLDQETPKKDLVQSIIIVAVTTAIFKGIGLPVGLGVIVGVCFAIAKLAYQRFNCSESLTIPQKSFYPLTFNDESISNENLFPWEGIPIPSDIARYVVKYLSCAQIAKMMELNHSWHHLIGNCKEIYIKKIVIASCLTKAKRAAIKDQSIRDLCNIAEFEIHHDLLPQAKQTIRLMENISDVQTPIFSSKAWFAILKIEIPQDRIQADETYKNITYPYYQSRALLEFAKIDPLLDLRPTKQMTTMISCHHNLVRALLKIAEVDPEHDLNPAKEAVERTRLNQSYFPIKIKKLELKYDYEKVKEDLPNIHLVYRSHLAYEILKFEINKGYLLQAKNTLPNISLLCLQAKAFLRMAKVDPQYLAQAKKFAQLDRCGGTFRKIVKLEAQQNLNQAEQTILTLPILGFWNKISYFVLKFFYFITGIIPRKLQDLDKNKSAGYFEILKIETPRDIVRAKRIAQNIYNQYFRTMAAFEFARADPEHDFTPIKKYSNGDYDLLQVCKVEALYDLYQAVQTANKLDSSYHPEAFIEIAKIAHSS